MTIRFENWKIVFMEQRSRGTMGLWTMIGTAFLETSKEFPPRQEPATFTLDHAVMKLHEFLAGR
jgi:arylsulfatase